MSKLINKEEMKFNDSMLLEEWRDIEGFEGYYQVSNIGRVKSLFRYKKILKGRLSTWGYLQVGLSLNGKRKMMSIHRLVALAFIDNPNKLPYVDHIDGCRTNNNFSNLRWCTQQQNCNFSLARLNISKAQQKIANNGHRYPNRKYWVCKKINQYSLDGLFVQTWGSIKAASVFYNVSQSSVLRAANKHWSCAGYLWRLYDGNTCNISPQKDNRFKKIIVIEPSGKSTKLDSIGDACIKYNLSRRSILNYIKGICKNRHGLTFKII